MATRMKHKQMSQNMVHRPRPHIVKEPSIKMQNNQPKQPTKETKHGHHDPVQPKTPSQTTAHIQAHAVAHHPCASPWRMRKKRMRPRMSFSRIPRAWPRAWKSRMVPTQLFMTTLHVSGTLELCARCKRTEHHEKSRTTIIQMQNIDVATFVARWRLSCERCIHKTNIQLEQHNCHCAVPFPDPFPHTEICCHSANHVCVPTLRNRHKRGNMQPCQPTNHEIELHALGSPKLPYTHTHAHAHTHSSHYTCTLKLSLNWLQNFNKS